MAEQLESPPKKQRTEFITDEFDKTNPFTKGRQSDEVELKFDTGESLFVSESFLSYASPVFETMFQSKFKESSSRCVKLTGKKYDDFLDMLLYLHPRVQKPITDKSAKEIYKLAHEYAVPAVLNIAENILDKQVQAVQCNYVRCGRTGDNRLDLDSAFEWLRFARTYGSRKLTARAAERISVMPTDHVTRHESYKEISDATKIQILMYRLQRCEKNECLNNILSL